MAAVPQLHFICVDVANGYSEHFVNFVKDVRQKFPTHTIMVSGHPNVSSDKGQIIQSQMENDKRRDMFETSAGTSLTLTIYRCTV